MFFEIKSLAAAGLRQSFVGLITVARKKQTSPYDTPPWRTSYRATSPDSTITAEISQAREHSMSSPTVGTLQISNGLETPRRSPAFLWSNDSEYLAVPQWIRRIGVFLRQRAEKVFASRFSHWLMNPKSFANGRLELEISSSLGINWMRADRLVNDVRNTLDRFTLIPAAHDRAATDKPMHGSGESAVVE